MQPQKETGRKTYSKTWENFIDRAMQIIVESPTQVRYVIKYVPKKNHFLLKVTDDKRIVMKKADANQQYEEIQKFTIIASRALTNQGEPVKKEVEEKPQKEKNKKKKKKN